MLTLFKERGFIFVFTIFMLLVSCRQDFNLQAEYKVVPVVYGLLDANADTNFVKITRSFYVLNDDATQVAMNPDSSDYRGKLDVRLQYAIADAGYAIPTPIQEKAIPPLLEGRDLIGCAQTGTGKTAAFMLPILHKLVVENDKLRMTNDESRLDGGEKKGEAGHPRALILSPTRELCLQIADDLRDFSKDMEGVHVEAVYGGAAIEPQVRALKKGVQIIVATPGRLIDLKNRG